MLVAIPNVVDNNRAAVTIPRSLYSRNPKLEREIINIPHGEEFRGGK
jgi:hypothetical protein